MALGTSPVQERVNGGRVSSINVTITAPAAGNCLIAIIGTVDNTVTVSSVSGGGVTWAKQAGPVYGPTYNSVEIWVGTNSSGSGTTVTITLSAKTFVGVVVVEWSGVANTSFLDGTPGTGAGTSATVTSGTVNTSNANDLIIAGARSQGNYSSGPASPYTLLGPSTTYNKCFGAYRVVSATGGYSTSWTSGSGDFAACIIALKAASSTAIATIDGLAVASVATADGLAMASVKEVDGLA